MSYQFSLSIESQGPKASPSLTSAVAVVMLGTTFSAPRLAPAAAAVLCCAAAQIIKFILLGQLKILIHWSLST